MAMEHTATGPVAPIERRGVLPISGVCESLLIRLLRRLRVGSLRVELPSGTRQSFEGPESGPTAAIRINNPSLVFRLLASGDLGFAEAYMDGDWDTPDLQAILMLGACNSVALSDTLAPSALFNALNRLRHRLRANTRHGSRRNIAAHYDLGNAFYGLWLDDTMSYSAGIFDTLDERHEDAQRRKYLRLADALDLHPGDRVLEIGCGWGGFAEIAAAEYGCHVVGLTLSREQAEFARARMARAGLADHVDIRIEDYRDVGGHFDKIVSIEMFEAVGAENWQTFFEVVKQRLVSGGRAAMQVISIADDAYDHYRRNPDFIQRYIFPGGMLPSPSAFAGAVNRSGLSITDRFFFGASYAESLRRWDDAFQAHWPAIKTLGFDERFHRMWRYYLRYCEVGFDSGQIDVGQYVIERP